MKKIIQHSLFFLFITLTQMGSAQAALQVFPTRLFLSPKKRVTQLSLRHIGPKTETYRITTVFYRMTPDGKMEKIETPSDEERPLLKFVRFSPREVKLPPNIEQTVKVMALPNEALTDGEYRAHILFEPVGEDNSENEKADSKDVAMKLSARIAVAVPVFYRQGTPEFQVSANELKLEASADGKQSFQARLNSSGKRFLYGDVKVFFSPNKGGEPIQVGTVLGVSSYVPSRVIQYSLTVPDGVQLKNGKLRLEVSETPEEGGKLLATTETPLP